MPITTPTKQTSLSILTLQENAGGTLSEQITGIARLISWSGKKLMGLIHTPNAHTAFAQTPSRNNAEAPPLNNGHDLSPTDINQQQSSPEENPSHSASKEAMASRIIASATVGAFIGGLPGAVACSGATFTGIQIKRALASQENKVLSTLALIALNLAAVILPDATEISTAYSEGRYTDVLTTIITKAPSNLLLGAILQIFIQSNVKNIANHCLPESAKPKNNELISAVCSGTSDALSLYSAPIVRQQIENFMKEFVHFPTVMGNPVNHPMVYSAPIGSHALQENSFALNLRSNDSSWMYPPAWGPRIDFPFISSNEPGCFVNLDNTDNHLVTLKHLSNKIEGAFHVIGRDDNFHITSPINSKFRLEVEDTFFYFTSNDADITYAPSPYDPIVYTFKFLLLSEQLISNFSIQYLEKTTPSYVELVSCNQANITTPYTFEISEQGIQYYLANTTITPSPTSSSAFSPTHTEESSLFSSDIEPSNSPTVQYPKTVYQTSYNSPETFHQGSTTLNLQNDASSWIYPPAWSRISNSIGFGSFNFDTAYKNYSIAFPNPSSRMQGALTFGLDCPLSQVPQYSLYLNSHTFNFSTLDGGPWLTEDDETGAMLYQIKFLILSEMPFSNFKIAFLSTNKDCFSTFESCTQYNLTSPYLLNISPTEIQYDITGPLPISTTALSSRTPTSSPTSNDSDTIIRNAIIGGFSGASAVIFIGGLAIFCVLKKPKNKTIPDEKTSLIRA